MLLAEAQHWRLRSAFGWVRLNCLVLMITLFPNKVCRQEAEQEGEAAEAAAAAGEDLSHQVDTIGDCELRSLLILLPVYNFAAKVF